MFELICLSYGVQYSLPVYLQANTVIINSQVIFLSWTDTTQCLLLVGLGVGIMIVSYYGIQRTAWFSRLPQLSLSVHERVSRPYILLALAASIAGTALALAGQSPSSSSAAAWLLRILSFQAYVGIALLAIWQYTSPERDRFRTALLVGGTVTLALFGLFSGLLEQMVVPPLIVVIVYWQVRRRFPVRWVLVGLVVFMTVNSVKIEYRQATWNTNQAPSVSSRVNLWLSLVKQRWEPQPGVNVSQQAQAIISPTTARLDLIHLFSWIHMETPHPVPYFEGSSYNYLLVGWVPRFVFPDKPDSSDVSIAFETAYGLLLPFQLRGSTVGVGHVAEAFANFGDAGVLIVMSLFGVFFALLRRVLDVEGGNGAWAAYMAILLVFLNGIGSYTAILFLGAIENILVTVLLLTILAARSRTVV